MGALDRIREALTSARAGAQRRPIADDPGLRHAVRRAAKLAESLTAIVDAGVEQGLRYVESGRGTFTLAFTPFEVATRFGELMRAQGGAWIFTSATLAVGDDFSHFLGRIGAPTANAVRIESPFDFESQAMVYLPEALPDPASREYTSRVVAAALPLVEAAGGRSFLLFTSHRALNEAAHELAMRPGSASGFRCWCRARRRASRCSSAFASSATPCCSAPRASGRASTCVATHSRSS